MTKNVEMPVVLDYKEYGLEESKANQITSAFSVNEIEQKGYMAVYSLLLTQEITEQTCSDASDLRKKLVKVRTNYEKIHKTEKAFYLAGGRFVDAYKNKKVAEVELMEEKLAEIEKYFENLDKEKKDAIEAKRKELLKPYPELNLQFFDLRNMDEELFQKLLTDQIELAEYKAKKAAEAEAERQKAEAKSAIEEERTAASIIYRDFIPNYDDIFLSDLTEEEFGSLIREAIGKKMDKDAEDERIRKENQKLKEEAAIAEAKAAEVERKNKELLEKQKAEAAEKLKAEQEKAAKLKAEADFSLKQAEEKRKALEKELADKQLAQKRIEEDKALKEIAEKEAAAKAAKAPDKVKLKSYVNSIAFLNSPPELKTEGALKVYKDLHEKLNSFKKWVDTQIEAL